MADPTRSVVAVVDDDHRTLESLADLLEAAGYEVRLYSSAAGLFAHPELRSQYSSIIERDRYFEKPYNGQQLLAAVRKALGDALPRG